MRTWGGLALVALITLGCTATSASPSTRVHADGKQVSLEGGTPLRALLVDVSWPDSLQVTGFQLGSDAARLNVIRSRIDGTSARIVITDTRRLLLPDHGVVLEAQATGDGALQVVQAQGAGDDGKTVNLGVDP